MKKIVLFVAMLMLVVNGISAQMKQKLDPVTRQRTIQLPTAPAPAPAPAPPVSNKTTTTNNATTQTTPIYSLTAAKVNIRTGSDNKEFPSTVRIYLWRKGLASGDYDNNCVYKIHEIKNEMAVNSQTELGLDKYAGPADKFLLSTLQNTGLELSVVYVTNFFMDAWKVENISLTLEFKDQNGNLHPTMGSKTISFTNAIGFLNSEYTYFKCITDQSFSALTASIGGR